MIDDSKEYTSKDVLTCDDALSLAVLGYKVRAVDMQDGCYVDYNFAGWRINFEGGSSSGWSARKHDYDCAWHVVDDEPAPLPVIEVRPTQSVALNQQKWGRIPRGLNVPEGAKVVVMDYAGVVTKQQAEAVARRDLPAPHVGKWGKPVECAPFTGPEADAWHKTLPPVVPTKDKWGKPT